MAQIETELQLLKVEVTYMYTLVRSQLSNARLAFVNFDKDLAREVTQKEKRVNATELKIDRDCENIFALFCPVAIDLRFLLAVLKINSNLERIGDIADGIAKYVIKADGPFKKELLEVSRILQMYDESVVILDDTQNAFEQEDTILARGVFKKDEFLDNINLGATGILDKYLKDHPEDTLQALWILSIIRRLERVGDQSKNIAEEIIFYLEAKVLKHNKKH
ncbi:MAG: phosphate signaling complex protein PhoU [Bacteroidota bacterium]|nr:phosphate signaling complex protein PhoU [Bacteroidota bacterium]MDP4215224.1 phosphate signaling complex protein PhoU [Bacteroidota bacterium]MDP4246178.1 phosphate signaling complex protein PhoU [Bacteroidota bacterium]MDP4252358.1 phosphate signaling complex protein PhoU [Bacteroidota bacterium]MDP4257915.1 phosphate signaling complex protein PhoU [Bacteroidota bacterium]